MADLERVRVEAKNLIARHLDPTVWSFAFDNAKTRAGLCNYGIKRITVSRYLASRYDENEIHQVLLHEVAHALAGPRAGHGPKWRSIAAGIGYVGKRTHSGEIANDLAPWIGMCPAGHEHYRYRRPTRPLACGLCTRRFSPRHLIDWQKREITQAERRRASASAR
ncbi:SprT-like domain-containing protein [Planctomonas psychrotolerans]|uniref:SprT-like domain-containing protein n=1 Tax=Planctomonas psychrotolerans TaxID=2528712 RepID=UPI001238BE73|nr:SprT-like domain-containing protein [Planctomonas psychrotolerans]